MKSLDRCEICDYTEKEGSFLSCIEAGDNGKVQPYPQIDNGMYCEKCSKEIFSVFLNLHEPQEKGN